MQEHYLGATIETARLDDSIYWRDQFVNGQEEMDGELHFSPTEVGYMQFGREFTGLFEVAICYCTTADALSVIDKRLIELYLDALA